jgi:RHS repeat-associated protein
VNTYITWRVTYRTWGSVVVEDVAEIAQRVRFQGQYLDVETGLHYNRFRYYEPGAGRFVSQDPIGLAGGSNLHLFAPNPLNWLDPLGLNKKKSGASPQGKCPCEKDPCEEKVNVTWTSAGGKHVASSRHSWKDVVVSTKSGPAKYMPGQNIQLLEREVWATGKQVSTAGKNSTWKIAEMPSTIGASEGSETSYMRVECTQGVIHGHPISKQEFNKLLRR